MDLSLRAAHQTRVVEIGDVSGVGEARRLATRIALSLQFDEADVGRVALVVTELATNIVSYAGRGELLLRPRALDPYPAVEIIALDQGPGIADIGQALRDGYSSGASRGAGLGAVVRLSSGFDLFSAPGLGTALLSRVARSRPQPGVRAADLDWGVVCVEQRGEDVCGDAWCVAARPAGGAAIVVVDGLGHGLLAFAAAQQALHAFHADPGSPPEAMLHTLHAALASTRGAVAAVAHIDWRARQLRYAGVGNIAGVLLPMQGRQASLVSHNGTLGANLPKVQAFDYPWPEGGLLVLHSDGLSSRWSLEPYPGLARKAPSLVAAVLYRDFARRRDDVVVLVGREPPRAPEPGRAAA